MTLIVRKRCLPHCLLQELNPWKRRWPSSWLHLEGTNLANCPPGGNGWRQCSYNYRRGAVQFNWFQVQSGTFHWSNICNTFFNLLKSQNLSRRKRTSQACPQSYLRRWVSLKWFWFCVQLYNSFSKLIFQMNGHGEEMEGSGGESGSSTTSSLVSTDQ